MPNTHPLITELGNPILRSRCVTVADFNSGLKRLVESMVQIMHQANGVGLAAPQVGSLYRVILIPGEQEPLALINPSWQSLGLGREPALEGCLSLPGITLPVEREKAVQVTALSLDGQPISFESNGLQARAVQHEVDHLDGILITDHVAPDLRYMALLQHINQNSRQPI